MKNNKIIIDIKDIPRIISFETYCNYAKEYGIKLNYKVYTDDCVKYISKSMSQLSDEIYNYELDNNILDGLYLYN